MNLFFGKTHITNDESLKRVGAHCHTVHHATPVFLSETEALIGYIRNGGRICGAAEIDDRLLVYSGCFFEPFPQASPGVALDEPDRAARVLLERYLDHGVAFLDGLAGYYAVTVWDARRRQLHLAADPYGQRALFYHVGGNSITFSSNLATTVSLLESPALDRSWEDFFLIYGFYPFGHTPFRGVMATPAGRVLSWSEHGRSERPIAPFAPSELPGIAAGASLTEAMDVLHEAFLAALEQQCGRDREVGVLLGGFDSAIVASGLRQLGKKVSTWSFSYEDRRYNQPHVADVAAFLDVEHHWVSISRQDLEQGLERFPWIFNQPTNWPNYVIQTAKVCLAMRDAGLGVAYSGDGCDTVFLGYPGTWRRAKVLGHVPSLPAWLSRGAASIAARPFLERRLGHPYRVFLNLIRTASWPQHMRTFLSFRLLDEVSLEQLRPEQTPSERRPLRETVEELARPHAHLPPLRLAYQGKSLVSPNKNKLNASSDVSGIPILSPYLHPTFKQLAQSIPEELCRPNERTASHVTGKYVLMKMAEEKRLLPKEVIYQRKVAAVDAPVDLWYAGPMRQCLHRQLKALPFRPDHRYVESLLDAHIAERLFQKYLLHDRIIKQAPSLLATYAAFCRLVDPAPTSVRTHDLGTMAQRRDK